MKNAQKPDHVSLNTLIGRLKEGRFVIPDFQREFEWEPKDIRDLMRSIFLDYYIGSLLLWKGKSTTFSTMECQCIYAHSGRQSPEHIVLDGQQRLTAMYYAFTAPNIPLPNRANRYIFYVHVDRFLAEEYDQAFDYAWVKQHVEKLLRDRESQFENHIFPLSIIGAGGWELPNWVQDYQKYWQQKSLETSDPDIASCAKAFAQDAADFGDHLKGLTEQYQITYVELDQDLAIEKVCDIFTQINSKGVQLDVFDLMNALLKPKGIQLKNMWRDAKPRLAFVESPKLNVYVLQVMSILLQAYCSPKYLYYMLPGEEKPQRDAGGVRSRSVLIADTGEFQSSFNSAVDAFERAIELLRHPQEFGVTSSKYLPYVSILPAFTAIHSHIATLPPARKLTAQRKARHWYWASIFTNRYSGSSESTCARDFLDIKKWLEDDAAEPSLIQEFKTRFRDLKLRDETKRGTSIYNGIFNLLVLNGARDWITGNMPRPVELDDHHIVPESWNEKLLSGSIHTILNRTPLTAETNRNVIGAKLPNDYLPELIKASGQSVVSEILRSHLISDEAQAILLRKPFTPADFEAFIAERQRTILEAIENLLVKERLDLPAPLRKLDARVEWIELAIRQAILKTLQNDETRLPPHIVQKVNERVQRACKKNAALNTEYYVGLEGKLEFFDLREVQDTLTSKLLWPEFESLFGSKESLVTKFDQLAELRNCLRHSRSVNEVVQKEGEAAIIWFKALLGK